MKNVLFYLLLVSYVANGQDRDYNKPFNKAYAPKYFPFEVKHNIYEAEDSKIEDKEKQQANLNLNNQAILYTPEVNRNLCDYLKCLNGTDSGINWFEAGPNNVGGRVRTLVVDRKNSNIVIAAGITGGIWKTIDDENSWKLKSSVTNNFNVTSIVQHPTKSNEWYASTGELNSSANGFRNNTILGAGVLYKSTDNGETWKNVSLPQSPDNYLYLTSKLAISPTTNTFFVATNGYGIARSTDGGATFKIMLGNPKGTYNLDYWTSNLQHCEVAVNSNGVLLAQISGEISAKAGFYKSTDDGITWTNITPSTFKAINNEFDIERSVIAFAPSNPNVAYAYTNSMIGAGTNMENIHFHKINVANGTFQDRSNNLVKKTYDNGAEKYRLPSSQNNYDMFLAVKPNDENFVVILGQSGPFRSFDGFATDAGAYPNWYGDSSVFDSPASLSSVSYPHPDQHVVCFDFKDANKLWLGNDGGISVIDDVTADNKTNYWIDKNNGFNVTQFYDLAIAPIGQGNKVMGATQDNSSPMLVWNKNQPSPKYTTIVSGGDGVSSDWQNKYIYTNGVGGSTSSVFSTSSISNADYTFPDVEGILPTPYSLSFSSNFVAINPNNENIIFLNSGLDKLYKGTNANSWPTLTQAQIRSKLISFDISLLGNNLSEYGFSKMAYSKAADILYFSLSEKHDDTSSKALPKIFKLQNASSASITSAIEISSPLFPASSYVSDIVINSLDANEFMVVLGTPNKEAVFYTSNGGLTYQSIIGNLTIGVNAPSLRCAEIVNIPTGKIYLLGTSMGLFSTTQINGNNTIWQNEALDKIGICTVTDIDFRSDDNMVAVATHGRGIFMGDANKIVSSLSNIIPNLLKVSPNPFQKVISITFDKTLLNEVDILLFDINGKKIKEFKEKVIAMNQKLDVDLSEVSIAGIYLLSVYDSSNHECIKTFKIIKE